MHNHNFQHLHYVHPNSFQVGETHDIKAEAEVWAQQVRVSVIYQAEKVCHLLALPWGRTDPQPKVLVHHRNCCTPWSFLTSPEDSWKAELLAAAKRRLGAAEREEQERKKQRQAIRSAMGMAGGCGCVCTCNQEN